MSDIPFMPKATAVWLVENTTLTFKQIAEFCDLHELEVKGIADGDVAKGIKAYNPILAGQLSREEIESCSKNPEKKLTLVKKLDEIDDRLHAAEEAVNASKSTISNIVRLGWIVIAAVITAGIGAITMMN